jgi:hypothetical protein
MGEVAIALSLLLPVTEYGPGSAVHSRLMSACYESSSLTATEI